MKYLTSSEMRRSNVINLYSNVKIYHKINDSDVSTYIDFDQYISAEVDICPI